MPKVSKLFGYVLTIGCNAIRGFFMAAQILMFRLMEKHPNRIYELRRAAKLSQEELGNLVGCSKMHISGLERGKRELTLRWMQRIADALGVVAADLLNDEDNPYRPDERERHIHVRRRKAPIEARETFDNVVDKVAETLLPYRHETREDDRDAA